MNFSIRDESPSDREIVKEVIAEAFMDVQHSANTEHLIVERLRKANALIWSGVAISDGTVVGHVAISPVFFSDGTNTYVGLGPVSVLPGFQGQGIGSKLIKVALSLSEVRGAKGCVVLGEPSYYQRFGFRHDRNISYDPVIDAYFQIVHWSDERPSGKVSYHEAFEK